ncbi:hypothetical protein ABZ752_15340 [Streptomyces roseifaciens]
MQFNLFGRWRVAVAAEAGGLNPNASEQGCDLKRGSIGVLSGDGCHAPPLCRQAPHLQPLGHRRGVHGGQPQSDKLDHGVAASRHDHSVYVTAKDQALRLRQANLDHFYLLSQWGEL